MHYGNTTGKISGLLAGTAKIAEQENLDVLLIYAKDDGSVETISTKGFDKYLVPKK